MMSTLKKLTLTFVALIMLVSSMGMNTYPAVYDSCSRRHKVGSNESLETIAMKYNKSVRTLMTLNKIPNETYVFAGQKLCVATYGVKPGDPVILIKNTVRDTNIVVRIVGFPKKEKLEIYMGTQGSQGRNGIKVATPTVDNAGVVEITVDIPAQLRGQAKLSLRAQTSKAKQYATQGFNNMTSVPGGYSDMPAASITGWVYNKSVTISLVNAPAGVTYKVVLVSSARRVSWHLINSTISTGAGGSISTTINLPASLKGNKVVWILLQDSNTGSFAYASYTNK
jgi:LysM repeat protein